MRFKGARSGRFWCEDMCGLDGHPAPPSHPRQVASALPGGCHLSFPADLRAPASCSLRWPGWCTWWSPGCPPASPAETHGHSRAARVCCHVFKGKFRRFPTFNLIWFLRLYVLFQNQIVPKSRLLLSSTLLLIVS